MANKEKTGNYHQFMDESLKFLVSGPSVFGWIIGIIHFPFKSPEFLMGFQNALTSLAFSMLYGIFHVLWLFFEVPDETWIVFIESLLSLGYLAITATTYIFYRKGKPTPGIQMIHSLLDRLFPDQEESISD
ncbi:MAG: hypothetical protein OEV66_07250 [Spirochaetia bacterium]|nr:hypothetical protein [Spirochaetia bacterium]